MKFFKHEKEVDQMATNYSETYIKGLKDMRNVVKAVLDSEEGIPFDLYYLEVKKRLANGAQFVHISTSQVSKETLASDDEKVKQAFYNKYGLAAFIVKTPTQLKKLFGESIQADLDKVVVYSTQNRVKYD